MIEPKPMTCNICDFGTGTRGMDRCSRCDGTGSVFFVRGHFYPNTKEGYENALFAQSEDPIAR